MYCKASATDWIRSSWRMEVEVAVAAANVCTDGWNWFTAGFGRGKRAF
jgi:hypothetical protein